MSWWLLLLEVFAVWVLWGVAVAAGHSVAQARRGIAKGHRGGVSLAPIIPVFPLGFWVAALLADLVVGPWGTAVVGWLHAALGVVLVWSIGLDVRRLRTLDKPA